MQADDDDWLDAADTHQGSSTDPLVEQEYQRLATRYSDAGYREGITDGKLSTLQQGFDESFATSVPLSRRLGQLRGRANALLAYLGRNGNACPSEIFDAACALVQDLAKVKRADVLPRDIEREKHEMDEHGEQAFELDHNDQREMEGLEDALGSLSSSGAQPVGDERAAAPREGALLDDLEKRLDEIKRRYRS